MTENQIPFSERDAEDLLTLTEAAEILRTSTNTLRWWRQRRTGPAFFKMGRRLVTTVGDLRAFMHDQRLAADPLIRVTGQ